MSAGPNSRQIIAGLKPFARAAIRDGAIHLAPWTPGHVVLSTEAAAMAAAKASGVTLVDLAREQDLKADVRELFILALDGHEISTQDYEALRLFASATGYHRLWLDRARGLIELPGFVAYGSEANVTCGVCGHVHREGPDSLHFWKAVGEMGQFPARCFICCSQLWQWTVNPVETDPAEDAVRAAAIGSSLTPDWAADPEDEACDADEYTEIDNFVMGVVGPDGELSEEDQQKLQELIDELADSEEDES